MVLRHSTAAAAISGLLQFEWRYNIQLNDIHKGLICDTRYKGHLVYYLVV